MTASGNERCEVQVDNGRVRISRWTLPPGAGTGTHEHLHDYVVVPLVQGRMQITDAAGKTSAVELGPGSSYFRTAGVVHEVVNGGDHDLSFVEVELVG